MIHDLKKNKRYLEVKINIKRDNIHSYRLNLLNQWSAQDICGIVYFTAHVIFVIETKT